jgi:hypothetical protein
MRSILPAIVLGLLYGSASAVAETPGDVVTAPDAVLCLDRDNVRTANKPAVARSQIVLRAMGCLRSEAGIPSRMLDRNAGNGPLRVRFYPAGISTGVVLWALPSAFTKRTASSEVLLANESTQQTPPPATARGRRGAGR